MKKIKLEDIQKYGTIEELESLVEAMDDVEKKKEIDADTAEIELDTAETNAEVADEEADDAEENLKAVK